MNDVVQTFKFASNLFQRAMLAIAGTLYALFTLLSPTYESQADRLLAAASAAPAATCQALALTQMQAWIVASIFAADAGFLWWRMFDRTPRLWWGRCINYFTACLWVTVAAATIFAYGRPLPDCVGEIMISFVSLHTLTRTDYTARDRATV